MDLITGSVQNYAWGSTTIIPDFLGLEADGRPQAELWFGAHPMAPSSVGSASLPALIEADPARVIGAASVARFGPRLPYLLKVLAADQPLSLQAHPTRAGAEVGFAREEAAGIDRSAPHRLYRDDWPKPEMLVALGDVEALCGFREPARTYDLFARLGVPAAVDLVAPLQFGGPEQLAAVFASMLRLAPGGAVIAQVVAAAAGLMESSAGAASPEKRELARFARTAVELDTHHPGDPGVLAGLLMNRLSFGRFEGLYLPARNLHAYLSGTGVEIMANSDNVMRGGLTPKHIDIAELVSVLDFTPGAPELVAVVAEGPGIWRYVTPAPEFAMWRIDLPADDEPVRLPGLGSGRMALVVEGAVEVSDQTSSRDLVQGTAVFGYPGETLTVTGSGTVMVAASGVLHA
ncbi:MAG: mannose-6-phosphate isomerase, class I [Microlunatus sp.]